NESIRSLWPLSKVLGTRGETGRTHDGRPLVNLSFAISYALHGLWKPGLRIGNLLIHLVNACLVFGIARRLVVVSSDLVAPASRAAADRHGRWLAAAIAIIWAVHPLHTHVNTYIVQRAESLAASFILGAFLASMTALDRGSGAAAVLATALAALGGLTKETTAAILPLVAAFDWAYSNRFSDRVSTAQRRKVRIVLYTGLILNPLVILAVIAATGGRGHSAGFGSAPVFEYFLTQCNAIWMYVGKVFWPRTLVLDHGDGLAALHEAWPWLLATVAGLILIAIGFWRRPVAFFPAVAAVLLLAPSSSVVPIATQTVAEHRAYVASAAVIGIVCAIVDRLARRIASRFAPSVTRAVPIVAASAVALIVVASIVRTSERNRDFTTATTLWTQNVRDCPRNPRGLRNLAELFTLDQRYDVAATIYRQALAIPELEPYAANGLGDALRRQKLFAEARDAYRHALQMLPPPTAAQFSATAGLAAAEIGLGSSPRALTLLASLDGPPWPNVRIEARDRWKTLGRAKVYRAVALKQLGDDAGAKEWLAKAIAYSSEHPAAAETIARACDEMGESSAAATLWAPLAKADPSLLANLAVSLIESGQTHAAIAAFRRAVAAYPDDPRMRANLARAEALAARQSAIRPPADR
ncbi:tetratricopeptide repeat protein, partial [bacterium]|nr:tetratricopeptide repeat protein [bacterium]